MIDSLIVKPVMTCNFACDFCSSTDIIAGSERDIQLPLELIFQTLERHSSIKTLILNGGDPLMVSPSYYFSIIEWLEARNRQCILSFTSNLWPFYKKPSKWIELFKHPLVGINTSFNYGDGRRITKDRVFTEQDFWQVSDAMLEHVGYRPSFISVITEDNLATAIDNVRLAQRMGVECKLNYVMASGRAGKPLLLADIYQVYVQIWEAGLWPWEFNTKQMARRLSKGDTCCPQARSCDAGIRALNPDGSYYSCGAFGDDQEKAIDWRAEMIATDRIETPLSDDPYLQTMHAGCYGCELFEICNGCRKTIKDLKAHDMVEDHCAKMKQLLPTIVAIDAEVRQSAELTQQVTGHAGFGDERTHLERTACSSA